MKKLILKSLILFSIFLSAAVQAQPSGCQASFTTVVDTSTNSVHFTNTSTGTYTNLLWSFGDGTGSTANNPIHPYNTTGTVTCCLTIWDVNGSCQSTVCDSIILGNPSGTSCSSSFSYQPAGSVFNFYGYTNVFGSNSTFYWTFGDGDSASTQFPTHTYGVPGTYNVCLTTTNTLTGCVATSCQQVTVAAPPVCQATFTHNNFNGASNSVSFISNYTSSTAQYSWSFGDGSTGTGHNTSHFYTTPGTYNVCLIVNDPAQNCSATYCDSVIIINGAGCQASFIYNLSPVLVPMVTFTNLSSGNATSWMWTFGDGDTSYVENPVHTYAQAGSYNVCLTISDAATNCNSTVCHVVNITTGGSQCNAFFGYNSNGGSTYHFSSTSAGFSHNWSFGDGTYSFQANPTHTFGAPGAYQVCHTVYDALQTCTDTYCDTIYINAGGNCTASYTYTVDSANLSITLTNTSTGVSGAVVWSFGDGTGSYSASPTHVYSAPGNYIVCLSITNPGTTNILCSYCQTIAVGNVVSSCVPVFYSYPDSNAIGNGNVHFGIISPCANTQFVWDFGDNTTGSGPNPVHMYNDSGWYYVCVTAFTPSGNYTVCDSVYAFRFTSSINETSAAIGLTVFPNPLAGNGQAKFTLATGAHVSAIITDMQGRIISTLFDETFIAGTHTVVLNTEGLQSGIYLLLLNINNVTIHQRISIVN